MLENIGGSEILLVVFVAFLFFGPRKLPELGRSLGKGLGQFRKTMRGIQQDIDKATHID
jgi:sec-independent protein translocase protein TatA